MFSSGLIGPAAVGDLSGQQEPSGRRRGLDVQVDGQRLGGEDAGVGRTPARLEHRQAPPACCRRRAWRAWPMAQARSGSTPVRRHRRGSAARDTSSRREPRRRAASTPRSSLGEHREALPRIEGAPRTRRSPLAGAGPSRSRPPQAAVPARGQPTAAMKSAPSHILGAPSASLGRKGAHADRGRKPSRKIEGLIKKSCLPGFARHDKRSPVIRMRVLGAEVAHRVAQRVTGAAPAAMRR